jgi:hypothetical protein
MQPELNFFRGRGVIPDRIECSSQVSHVAQYFVVGGGKRRAGVDRYRRADDGEVIRDSNLKVELNIRMGKIECNYSKCLRLFYVFSEFMTMAVYL